LSDALWTTALAVPAFAKINVRSRSSATGGWLGQPDSWRRRKMLGAILDLAICHPLTSRQTQPARVPNLRLLLSSDFAALGPSCVTHESDGSTLVDCRVCKRPTDAGPLGFLGNCASRWHGPVRSRRRSQSASAVPATPRGTPQDIAVVRIFPAINDRSARNTPTHTPFPEQWPRVRGGIIIRRKI
jgi:hypothetical protein